MAKIFDRGVGKTIKTRSRKTAKRLAIKRTMLAAKAVKAAKRHK
jgi:hypothetical protein